MGKVVLSASMSLDGFSAGPGVGLDQPMGRGGERLHEWLFDDGDDGKPDAQIARERVEATGAVVVGRRTFDVGIGPWGDVPFPVPCFVLTHAPVLLGAGTRLFDHLGPDQIELERTAWVETPHVMHLRFRVVKYEGRSIGAVTGGPARIGELVKRSTMGPRSAFAFDPYPTTLRTKSG
jgi:dihydrofolate reductase